MAQPAKTQPQQGITPQRAKACGRQHQCRYAYCQPPAKPVRCSPVYGVKYLLLAPSCGGKPSHALIKHIGQHGPRTGGGYAPKGQVQRKGRRHGCGLMRNPFHVVTVG